MPEHFEPVNYNAAPSVQSEGVGAGPMTARANANDFGGQVGGALQNAGKQGLDIANQFQEQATESRIDDTLANKFTPAAAALRSNYDLMSPQDKLNGGHDQYLTALQKLGEDTVQNEPSGYGQKLLNSFILRHRTEEVFGVNKETVEAQKQYGAQSKGDLLLSQSGVAIDNWNNPGAEANAKQTVDGKIELAGQQAGQSPEEIDQTKRQFQGNIASGQIEKAADAGDVTTANDIYHNNKEAIPGAMRIESQKVIHSANMLQFSRQAGDALISGQPIPPNGGQAALNIKSTIADRAQSTGFDPNTALTVARIESNYGQNTGVRGTIGQDKLGGTPSEQIDHLIQNLKVAKTTADQVVGGNSTPDQQYMIYQQGAGGGAALLRASMTNPNAKAVDVVSQFYKNPKDALNAIQNNGGNATMTAGQFTNYIKDKFATNAKFAQCDIPPQQPNTDGNVAQGQQNFQDNKDTPAVYPADQAAPAAAAPQPTLGQAMQDAHTQTIPAVQPAANPEQALKHFDESYSQAIIKANMIPNLEERASVVKYLDQKRATYEASSNSYKQGWQIKAEQLGANPDFTSEAQIPPSWKSNLPGDTLHYLQQRMTYNIEHGSNPGAKDERTYGTSFTDMFHQIHAPDGDPNKITSLTQLQAQVGKTLTIAGYDKLKEEMVAKGTPEGEAEAQMKNSFFKMAESQISGKDPALGMADPKGQEQYQKFMTKALASYAKGKTAGLTAEQMLDPDSKDYIGSSIKTFKRPTSQWMADMMQDNPDLASVGAPKVPGATPAPKDTPWYQRPIVTDADVHHLLGDKNFTDKNDISSPESLKADYAKAVKENDTNAMRQYIMEAEKRGYIRGSSQTSGPQVPTAE